MSAVASAIEPSPAVASRRVCRLGGAAPLWLLAAVLAGLTLLGPAQPSYDPWAWLLWGREIAGGTLSTAEGPAFKPLPVLLTTAFAPFGADVAPVLWLWVARTGAIAAVLLAGRVAWRLGGGVVGAGLAAAGVALTGGALWHGAVGHVELGALALVLTALDRGLADGPGGGDHARRPRDEGARGLADVGGDGDHIRRPRGEGAHGLAGIWGGEDHIRRPGVLVPLLAVALLRVEAWPFLLLAVLAWRVPLRWVVVGAAGVLAAWFVPELVGSGDLLRSGSRAQVPNPGQPATADVPLLASLGAATGIAAWPLVLGAVAAPRGAARVLAALGVAWVALVAAMAQAGFSGEPRYHLPGVALLAVPGAIGWAHLMHRATGRDDSRGAQLPSLAAVAVVGAVAVALALPSHVADARRIADEAQLHGALPVVVERAGGREAVLSCGRPATGRFRGPAVAYALDVEKQRVLTPGTGGATFRSRLRRSRPVEPPAAPGRVLARSARWELRCAR